MIIYKKLESLWTGSVKMIPASYSHVVISPHSLSSSYLIANAPWLINTNFANGKERSLSKYLYLVILLILDA